MTRVDVNSLSKRFGDVTALDAVDLTVEAGESLVVLGPSGSGKSTLLRILAGLEVADAGSVRFDGVEQAGIEPHRRDVAIVFQQYALYPHLSARDNIAMGLRHGLKLPKEEIAERVADVTRRLQIEELLDRRPRAMSGGQRQRVALSRALARRSGIVLLDEPMSGLDAKLRVELRVEIAEVLRSVGATSVHVTHDQLDALSMADRVAVMRDGRIEQHGPPAELYERPCSVFVADFLGSPPMNLLPLQRHGQSLRSAFGEHAATVADATYLGVRPEKVQLGSDRLWTARMHVATVELAGPDLVVHGPLEDGTVVSVRCGHALAPRPGEAVPVTVDPSDTHVFGGPGDRLLGSGEQLHDLPVDVGGVA